MSEPYTLEELRTLGEGVTPGEWEYEPEVESVYLGTPEADVFWVDNPADARLIAAAPRLLAQAAAQAEELARLREMLGEKLAAYDQAVVKVAEIESDLTPEQRNNMLFIGGGEQHDEAVDEMQWAKLEVIDAVRAVLAPAKADAGQHGEGE